MHVGHPVVHSKLVQGCPPDVTGLICIVVSEAACE